VLFTNAAGPRQRSHSLVRVPQENVPVITPNTGFSVRRLLRPQGYYGVFETASIVFLCIIYNDSVPISQETHYISTIKPSQ
jgi:hypothetical protein